MIVKVDFNLSTWVKELLIEADSEADALNKVREMTTRELITELINTEAIIDSNWDISDARTEVVEHDVTVKASNIEYDFTYEKLDPAVVEYLKVRLPKEMTIRISGVALDDDIEDFVRDEILTRTNYEVDSLDYEIIESK